MPVKAGMCECSNCGYEAATRTSALTAIACSEKIPDPTIIKEDDRDVRESG